MQHLFQPRVLNWASLAAALTTLACYPELSLVPLEHFPVWFLLADLFFCSIILWAFVFAWHTPYTGKPVFSFKFDSRLWLTATLAGAGVAAIFHLGLDPDLRAKFPREYPADWQHWLASVFFSFALTQLFLVFAACDWLMRLTRNRTATVILAGLFAAGVQAMKIHSLKTPVSPAFTAALLATRFASGMLAVWFYLRGGIFLVWWWALIQSCRLLLDLFG